MKYSTQSFIARVEKQIDEINSVNSTILMRQVHIASTQEAILNRMDSLYLQNK